MSYLSIPLIEIISSDILQTVTFEKDKKKGKGITLTPIHNFHLVQFAKLTFRMSCEEIWDFGISFKDFMASNVAKKTRNEITQISPCIKIQLEEYALYYF